MGPSHLERTGARAALSFHFEEPITSNTVFIVAELSCCCGAKLALTVVPIHAISGQRDGRTVRGPEHFGKICQEMTKNVWNKMLL